METPRLNYVLTSIQKALLSLLQPAILLRLLIPLFASVFFGIFILIFFWSSFIAFLSGNLLEITWLSDGLNRVFSFLGTDASGVLFFLSGFIFVIIVLMSMYAVTLILFSTLLVPLLIPPIRRIYYPELPIANHANFFASLGNSLKAICVFLFFFIISFPLFLIPGMSLLIPLILNSYLAQKVFPFDVLQDIASTAEIKSFQQQHKNQMWMLAFSTGILIYIPLVNFLAPAITALSFIFYIFDSLIYFRQNKTGVK